MNFIVEADILIFSFIVLIFLLTYYIINAPQKTYSKKIFITIIVTLMINTALAVLACLPNGINEPWAVSLNKWLNSLILIFSFLPITAWAMFVDYRIFHNFRVAIKRTILYLIPFYVITILICINAFTGFIFTIENGIYTTQSGIFIIHAVVYLGLIVLLFLSHRHIKLLKMRTIRVVLLFLMLPMAANFLMLIYPKTNFVWPAFALATVMIFIMLEKDSMLKDSLTKLNTRVSLESRIKQKLRRKEPFSLIMIDLDGFKQINDSFGHKAGDDALMVVASILEDSVKRTDMVCRFGGDEFLVLVESPRANAARYIRDRIKSKISAFNKKKVKPYEIAMSFGIKFFSKRNVSVKKLMVEVDRLMYADKEKNRKLFETQENKE